MRNQTASELRSSTTTRSVYAMFAGELMAIVMVGVAAIATDSETTSLAEPLQRQAFLNVSMTIAPLFALLLGLRSFTDEFRFGSIVPTPVREPEASAGARCEARGYGSRRPRVRSGRCGGLDRGRGADPDRQGRRPQLVGERDGSVGRTHGRRRRAVGHDRRRARPRDPASGCGRRRRAGLGARRRGHPVGPRAEHREAPSPARPAWRSSASTRTTSWRPLSARCCSVAMRSWRSPSGECSCSDEMSLRRIGLWSEDCR